MAYHTALLQPHLKICVVERDHSFTHASAMLSCGGVRQQFSLAANIKLSMYGIDFLKRLPVDLAVRGEPPPDVQFREQGYLFLASPDGEATLRRNHATQQACGVDWTTLLGPAELAARFPWLKTDGLALGCVGEENEGWFDPWALVAALRAKAKSMGVEFVQGEARALGMAQGGEGRLRIETVGVAAGGPAARAASTGGALETIGAGQVSSGGSCMPFTCPLWPLPAGSNLCGRLCGTLAQPLTSCRW